MSASRDNSLLHIRPLIEIVEKDNQSEFELFQNKTLRQICKLQNDLILNFVDFYINDKNITFKKHAPADKINYINSLFTKDTSFKNTLRGLIVGHFTADEFLFYKTHIAEINKRIIQLVKTRFLSQFEH